MTALGAGSHHSCAVIDDALWCWGGHGLGPEGSSGDESGRPVRLEAFGSVRGVVGGKSAVCAVAQDGGVRCAGVNDDGQLGTAPAVFAPAPQPVEGIAAIRELSLGLNHGCARGEDTVVRCWGSNRDGQCGQPTGGAAVASLRPLAVPLPGPARHISAGGDHSCALLQDGQVACWGSDTSGSRGSRSVPAMIGGRGAPEIIPGVQNAVAVGAGGSGTCILTTARELYCVSSDLHDLAADWGRSGDYGFSRVPLPSIESFDLDGLSGCAVDGEGVSCFDVGNNISTVAFDGVASPLFRPAAVGFSIGGSCALSTDGRVACWGRAFDGRLGDGSTDDRDEPGLVPGLSGVRSLAVGSRHRCALDGDGAAYCWGSHRRGSTGSTSSTPLPNRVAGVSRGRQLDVGSSHACAVTEGGQVYCWGNDRWGQCGQRFSTSSPSAHLVRGLPTINEVDVGESHSCALATDGRVFCWGKASSGQLGNGQSNLILPARPIQH